MSDNTIVGPDGEAVLKVPTISSVRPCGTQVLVELLTAQEALGTILQMGFKVGDRVTLHGNYTPVPEGHKFKRKNSHRPWILIEPHQIKAVFVEEA
jgi:hypothetical protein